MEHIIIGKLAVSHAQASLLFTVPLAVLAVIAIPSGILVDKIGVGKATLIGAILLVLSSLLRGTFTSYATILVFTILYGIGFALIFPNLPKLVSTWFPREKVGLATGLYTTGMCLGPALALGITLPLIYPITNSYQGTIYIWTIPAMAGTVLWWIAVRGSYLNPVKKEKVTAGTKSSFPMWKNRNIWLVGLMLFLLNIQYYTWSAWTPALLMQKGANPDLATAITSVRSWAGIPFIFLIPWVSYRVGLKKPFLWSCTAITALASWSAMYISVPLFWPLMVVLAITGNVIFAMLLSLPVELVPREAVGSASGMVLSLGYTGAIIGPWIAGGILDTTESLVPAIIMLVGVAVLWTFIAFIIPETGARANKKIPVPNK